MLSVHDVSDEKLQRIISLAEVFRCQNEYVKAAKIPFFKSKGLEPFIGKKGLEGRVLGTLFLEPSTRTRWSFESAMIRLGGGVISSESSSSSSVTKGESIEDTINTCAQYVDTLVVRSSYPLTDVYGKCNFCIPDNVINAGDGPHEHPTQAILDAYTIFQHYKRLDKLHIGISGDLVQSRAIHSLLGLLGRNAGNSFTLYNPAGEELPKDYEPLAPILYCEDEFQFKKFIPKMDVVYLNRTQRERWTEKERTHKQHNILRFDQKCLNLLGNDAIVMNPGPRLGEMPILDDNRVVYFEQSLNGLFARMSILCHSIC